MSRRNKKVSQTKNKKGDQPGQAKRRIRRRYTDRERRSAVKDVAQLGLSGAARKHDIATSTLHAWTKSPRWTDGAPPSESDGGTSSARRGRFTAEDRKHAIGLVASGMKRAQVARELGASQETIRLWVRAAEADGSMPTPTRSVGATSKATKGATSPPVSTTSAPFDSPPAKSLYAPRDPGQGLSDVETAAILELKKKHPSMGPAQIRAQLKRFRGWRVSIKAIARVLRNHGYESVHRGSRPQGPEPIRFEAPRRNALWQLDYAEMRVTGQVLHLLVVLDDFSRFCVGHVLGDQPSAKTAIAVLGRASARHGKPEAVRTDRGGGFRSDAFTAYLENELIDHIMGHPYHPQGGGKVESLIGTVRRELWDVEHFDSRTEAERRLGEFLCDYNEHRAHLGIDGLTPADRFFGRADRVLAVINGLSRQRQCALGNRATGLATEELLEPRSGAPLEVLRLVAIQGHLELRFAGHRVVLGRLQDG